jgi:hypothetical protein
MRDIMLMTGWIRVPVMALAELVVFFGLLKKYLYSRKHVALYMMFLALALFYEAAVVGLGRFLGNGTLLEILNRIRYILHGLLMPLLLPICAYALEMRDSGKRIIWIIMLICIIAGTAAGRLTVIEPQNVAGILRYAPAESTSLRVSAINTYLSLGMAVPVVITGIIMIFKAKTLWMFLAGAAIGGFSYLGLFTGNNDLSFMIMIAGNLLMTLFFLLYTGRLKRSYL